MLLVILLYATFGFTFTLSKIIIGYAGAFFSVAARMLIAGTGLLGYIYFAKRIDCYPQRAHISGYLQATLFGIFIPYCLRSWALQYISTTKSALLFNFMPLFTAVFAYFFLKERMTWLKLTGLGIGFFGMIPVLLSQGVSENAVGSLGFISLPELATLGAVASFGYNFIVMQRLVKHHGCSPFLVNGIAMLLGGTLSLCAASIVEPVWIKQSPLTFIGLMTLQIIFSNIICANLQATLLKQYSSTFMAFANFLSPLFAACYGWLLFGEEITWHFAASFVVVFIGLCFYYFDEFGKHRHNKVPALDMEG